MTYPHAAVLTGDLVSSRDSASEEVTRAMTVLQTTAQDIGQDAHLPATFERHRGDGWQIFLPKAAPALRAALRVIAALTAAETGLTTRISIGLGDAQVDGPLASASGTAFVTAGDGLDAMDRGTRLSLSGTSDTLLPAMVGLLDWQSQRWTPAQAEALFEALRAQNPTQAEIADKLGVKRQAIQQRLAATGLPALRAALDAFETTTGHRP